MIDYGQLLKIASPEAIMVVTALVVLTVGLTAARNATTCSFIAVAGMIAAGAAVMVLPLRAGLPGGMLVITPLTSLFKLICLALACATVILARNERSLKNQGEYIAMIVLGTIGLMLLVGTEEFLMIFIGLELTGLCLYIITGFDRNDVRGAEAALKYFLFGSTASAFTLFGISLIYGTSGTTSLAVIAEKFATGSMQPLLAVGVVMTLVGLTFKIAAAPFHLWAPDAYEAGPVSGAGFIASASKVAAFFVLGKIVLIGFTPLRGSAAWHAMTGGWAPILAAVAALSIIIGNFVALAQKNVRRLLAYSAVAHAGYTLLGLIAGGVSGFSATLFYTTVYAVTLVGAFGVVSVIRRETGGDDIADFGGLWESATPGSGMRVIAGCMAIFMLSLAGLPPLAGFFGKFFLFSAAVRGPDHQALLWLVAVALFGSLVSLYYYLMVLKAIFLDHPVPAGRVRGSVPPLRHGTDALDRIVISALALAVVLLGILPGPFADQIAAALK